MNERKKPLRTQESIDAHNAVMLPKLNAVITALKENPDDPIALKNFNETFDFYRMRKNDEN